MGRNAIGYEIDLELKDVILERVNINTLFGRPKIEVIEREDTKRLRTKLREKIDEKLQQKMSKERKVSQTISLTTWLG